MTENKILYTETCSQDKFYIANQQETERVAAVSLHSNENKTLKERSLVIFHELFLPQGYPHSVSDDYTKYQIWDTAQAFCSTVLGILATHEILKGVGVGDATASATAATITWVMRDATAHIGRITFAWSKGTSMDTSSKQWRIFADILNDAAFALELMLPLIGQTMWLLCLTTAMKSIVGVAGSATRVALTQHQALRNNLADVAAKDSSQETAVNLIASLTTIAFFPKDKNLLLVWWLVLTGGHIYFNYRAVRSICLNTINRTRFLQLIKLYLKHEIVAPPSDINLKEPIFKNKKYTDVNISGFKIKIGHSLSNVLKQWNTSQRELAQSIELYKSLNYLILIDSSRLTIHILLNDSAASPDIFCAYFHAVILGIMYHSINRLPLRILNPRAEYANKPFAQLCRLVKERHPPRTKLHPELLRFLRDVCVNEWKQLHQTLLDAGWETERQLMDIGEWRGNWVNPSIEDHNHILKESTVDSVTPSRRLSRQHRTSEWMLKSQDFIKIRESCNKGGIDKEIIVPGKPTVDASESVPIKMKKTN